ncbi:hypothetical protein HY772_08180 [Candidatus Woesearchaeota archaeon]|nr:hypothetical protein [Candidatus Woesearchaeota archaeon]
MTPEIRECGRARKTIFYLILLWLLVLVAQGIVTYNSLMTVLMTGKAINSVSSMEATISFNVVPGKAPLLGGGGEGGGGTTVSATHNIGDIASMQETLVVLARNEKVELTKDSVKHTIELTSVSANAVTLRISSVVQVITLLYGETKAVDLDQDAENDISIQLTNVDVVANKATLKITSLRAGPVPIREVTPAKKKEAPKEQQASVMAPAPPVAQPQEEAAPQQSAQAPVEPLAESTSNGLIIAALFGLLLIAEVALYIGRHRRQRKKHK